MTMTLQSDAFLHGGPIPFRHTCDGDDVSPPLNWRGAPAGTRSLVLIVDDPDAPDPRAPKRTWVHWVLYNLPPDLTVLPAGITQRNLPQGAAQGINDGGHVGYGGPCPPIGRHRYFHKLYALDMVLQPGDRPTKANIETAMRGHILGKAELVGTYQKGP